MITKGHEYHKMFTKELGEFYGKLYYDTKKKKFVLDITNKKEVESYEQFLKKIKDRLNER